MLGLQRFSHHAHRVLVQPVQAGLLLQEPWRRTRPQGLCQASIFYTTLVKKSQQSNGASELRRTPLPRTRVHRDERRARMTWEDPHGRVVARREVRSFVATRPTGRQGRTRPPYP